MKRTHNAAWRGMFAAAAPLMLVVACASHVPIQLHTLSANDAPPTPGAAVMAPPARGVVIEPVSVPRYADIPELLFTAQDGVSRVSEAHRWRAPLSDEIAAALSQRLQSRYGVMDVSRLAVTEGMPVMRVRLDVQRFEALPGSGEVLVSVAWSLRSTESRNAALQCAALLRRPVTAADPDALVRAYRAALETLGDQIGRALQALQGPGATAPPMCPPAA
jgi:uncharacterized lipoprotein YmbA